MDYYMKLPRNKKEFGLFMLIVSVISVNIIAPLITCFETNFSVQTWLNTLEVLPFIWLCVIALVILTYKPAEAMTNKILKKEDSYNAHILTNILCTVFLMSIILTIVATWIGERFVSWEAFELFFYRWPRNFAISIAVECFIAQPIARFIIFKMHKHNDAKHQSQGTN